MNRSIIFFDSATRLVNPIDFGFNDKKIVELFIATEKNIDQQLTGIISENIIDDEFTNIIIPVCFGDFLSNFLGLRFATHIRCTTGINQHANIFLYSFTGIKDYFSNECFNILRTKGVFLIDYNIDSIINSTYIKEKQLSKSNLVHEVKKLKLDVPLNYEDSHSIANEWAIYKWSNTIEATDGEIVKIGSKLENDLYFKYLKTIYPISKFQLLKEDDLELNFEGKPTVLYIDDEAEKGWKEIFEKILIDNNNTDFIHLGNEFSEKKKNEVVEFSLKEVIDEDVDLVILDFRLHKEDFEKIPIEDITGYQILKRIKEYNKGIQVIIFSATNKIWNLQALQEAGADGFILKESPENNFDFDFTKQSVLNMIDKTSECLGMIFLKDINNIIKRIKNHLNSIPNNTNEGGLDGLMKMKFKNEIFIQLDIIYDCLKKSSEDISTHIKDENSYLNLSFISIYKIVELINDYYTDNSGRNLKSNATIVKKYDQNSNTFLNITTDYPTTRDKIYSIINFELNSDSSIYVNNLNRFIKFRNNIIHPKTLKDYKKTSKEENVEFLNLVGDLITKIN
jgi:CheY-like chemotaxis protein